jgi:CHAT domain-containing protein
MHVMMSDGDRTLKGVCSLDLKGSHMVVLSTCKIHLGERVGGDKPVSLANGLIYARTASVVSSPWKFSDECTRILMDKFCETLS